MLPSPISLPNPASPQDPFRAKSILRQYSPARLSPEILKALDELIPMPPPFAEREEVFSWHYLYHLARRRAAHLRPRPTLGELMMTSGLTKITCRRCREEFERDLDPLL